MKTLGLVTGLGMGAGIFYYRQLVSAYRVLGVHPQIVMVHADVQKVMDLALRREVSELATYLRGLLEQLKRGGADLGCIPAFSPQVCDAELKAITPLPLLSPLDAIVQKAQESNHRRFVVLGAQVTMETQLFGRLKEFEIVGLPESDTDTVASIYKLIAEREHATTEQFNTVSAIAQKAVTVSGADAVILAGTDFSFVFNETNTNFPCIDGARAHISALIEAMQ